ncbi:hypothetical protein SBADM41S_04818 [Streptomyces badius]
MVLLLGATAAGSALVAPAARIPVAVCGAITTLVVAVLTGALHRARRATRVQRAEHEQRIAYLEHRIHSHDAETVRLTKEVMPAAIRRLRVGNSPDEVMRDIVDADAANRHLPKALREQIYQVLEVIDNEEARRDSAHAFVSVARRVQAIVHRQASELREMEDHYGRNPEVFDDLLRIDHGTALIGRLADSIAGAWRRPPQPPVAQARTAVQRVARRDVPHPGVPARRSALDRQGRHRRHLGQNSPADLDAAPQLPDNATRYSPPQTRVHVTAVEVQTGIAIEIEDGGVSLSEEARARAENMLAQAQAGINMNDLGESPRLGMAVVGRLFPHVPAPGVAASVGVRRRPRRPHRAARDDHDRARPGHRPRHRRHLPAHQLPGHVAAPARGAAARQAQAQARRHRPRAVRGRTGPHRRPRGGLGAPGHTVSVIGLLNPAFGNACINK